MLDNLETCVSRKDFFLQYLADIEEHLGETISMVEPGSRIPVNEFDGKVVYGEKRSNKGEVEI